MSIDDSNDFCSRDFILLDAMSPHNAAGHRIALGCVASRCQRHCWHITTATSQFNCASLGISSDPRPCVHDATQVASKLENVARIHETVWSNTDAPAADKGEPRQFVACCGSASAISPASSIDWIFPRAQVWCRFQSACWSRAGWL